LSSSKTESDCLDPLETDSQILDSSERDSNSADCPMTLRNYDYYESLVPEYEVEASVLLPMSKEQI